MKMKMKRFLFVKTGCDKCKSIAESLDNNNVKFETIILDKDEYGRHMGYKLNVNDLPMIVEVKQKQLQEVLNSNT